MQNYDTHTYFEQNGACSGNYNLQDEQLLLKNILLASQKNNLQNDEIVKNLKKIRNIQKKSLSKNNYYDEELWDKVCIIEKFLKQYFHFNVSAHLHYERKKIKKNKKILKRRY